MSDEEQNPGNEGGEQPGLDDEGIEPMDLEPFWGTDQSDHGQLQGLDLTETQDEFRTEQGAGNSTIERDEGRN
jgi:hypothetical protein